MTKQAEKTQWPACPVETTLTLIGNKWESINIARSDARH